MRVASLSVFLLIAPAVAGCIGDSGPIEGPEEIAQASTGIDADGTDWSHEVFATAEYVLATARPFGPHPQRITVVAGCGWWVFEMPNGTTYARINVQGPPVNETRPGAGYASFKTAHEDAESWRVPPENDRPRANRTVEVDDPRPGSWILWVWPWGPNVNQAYDVSLTFEGRSAQVPGAPVLEPARACE